MGLMHINNVEIYYECHGQPMNQGQEVLVLIHGYLSSSFSFRKLVPFLEKQFAILSIDLPGFGQSEKSLTFNYSLHNYGALLLDVLKELKVQDAVLVGHSMGGQIALQAALQNTEVVKKVIGLAAAGYMGPVKRSLVLASYLPFFSHILKIYFKKKDIAVNFSQITNKPDLITQEMMDGYIQPLDSIAFFKSLIKLMRDREGDLPPDQLQNIQQPVFLMWGDEDRIVPPRIGERFVKDLPNVHFKIFHKAGHLLPEELPEEIAQEIARFLQNS